jgi:hypothetical protein
MTIQKDAEVAKPLLPVEIVEGRIEPTPKAGVKPQIDYDSDSSSSSDLSLLRRKYSENIESHESDISNNSGHDSEESEDFGSESLSDFMSFASSQSEYEYTEDETRRVKKVLLLRNPYPIHSKGEWIRLMTKGLSGFNPFHMTGIKYLPKCRSGFLFLLYYTSLFNLLSRLHLHSRKTARKIVFSIIDRIDVVKPFHPRMDRTSRIKSLLRFIPSLVKHLH